MRRNRTRFLFLNVGHTYDHLFMLLFPTVVLTLEGEFERSYGELLALAVPGFIAFGVGTLPAGWLGDRWSRSGMMAVFFFGIGVAAILTSFASTPFQIAAGLALIGLFASIYHPVGIAMIVQGQEKVGRLLGINGVWGNMGIAAAAFVAAVLMDLITWRAAFLVPGIVSILTGVAYVWASRSWTIEEKRAGRAAPRETRRVDEPAAARRAMWRVIIVLSAAAFLIGMVFQASTIALPKVFDEGLGSLTSSALGVGGMVSLVVGVAAFAQIGIGHLIDRFSIKAIWIAVLIAQVPLLVLVGAISEAGLLIAAFAAMVVILGEIPIQDALLARHTPEHWRSRIYGAKFSLALGASALSTPLVAALHGTAGGFMSLFGILAACAAAVIVLAFWLPERPYQPAHATHKLGTSLGE